MNENQIQPNLPSALPTAPKATRKSRKKDLKNIYKRGETWYFVRMVKGKRQPVSLGTNDLVLAKAKRDALLKAETGIEIDRVLGRDGKLSATLGDIFDAYMRSPMIRANETTRRRNLADLERMVCAVKGPATNVRALSSKELNWQMVEEWQTQRVAAAERACADDRPAFEAAKRTINSLLTHVQSIFSTQARAAYRALYLPPNIADFATALPVSARKQEEPVHLSDSFMLQLIEDSKKLRAAEPATWVAFQLMTWGGLRNSEVCHARRSWLQEAQNGYELSLKPCGDFVPKGNSRTVIIPNEIAQEILALPPVYLETGEIDDHLVPAKTKTEREEACYRRLNKWLKDCGVGMEAHKISYQLRKYFLKKVAVQQHPLMAQSAGGHSSLSTTQDHYIGKPKMTEPIRLPTDLSQALSYRVTERPEHATIQIGEVLDLSTAAQLLELNAADLAARSERAEAVTLDGFVLTVRREGGINGRLIPPPVRSS